MQGSHQYDLSPKDVTFSGFSVSNNGLIMSVAHALHKLNLDEIKIIGRRLDREDYKTLKLKSICPPWDVMILEAENVEDDFGEFVSDGALYEGQPLFICGNPLEFVGSNLVGKVSLTCVEDVTLPTGNEKCRSFKFDVWKVEEPRYRIFGDMWNRRTLSEPDRNNDFFDNCDPMVPYILCHGFTASPGVSGSPAFNSDGKIVGMLSGVVVGYVILTHVTLLRHFLNEVVLGKHPLPEKPAERKKSKRQLEKEACRSFFQDMKGDRSFFQDMEDD